MKTGLLTPSFGGEDKSLTPVGALLQNAKPSRVIKDVKHKFSFELSQLPNTDDHHKDQVNPG